MLKKARFGGLSSSSADERSASSGSASAAGGAPFSGDGAPLRAGDAECRIGEARRRLDGEHRGAVSLLVESELCKQTGFSLAGQAEGPRGWCRRSLRDGRYNDSQLSFF
eukprot:254682_1